MKASVSIWELRLFVCFFMWSISETNLFPRYGSSSSISTCCKKILWIPLIFEKFAQFNSSEIFFQSQQIYS